MNQDIITRMMNKLSAVCASQGWIGETWCKGIAVIERRCNCVVYLSKFEPQDMIQTEQPTATISIQVID